MREIAFHFSYFGLSLLPKCFILLIILSKHFTVGVSGGVMSGPGKMSRLQRPSEISELIFGSDRDEARVSSEVISVEGVSEGAPGLSQPQQYRQTASCHKSRSSILSTAFDE